MPRPKTPTVGEVVMPRLSDSMEEGTIVSWIKAVGDEVAVGDALVEIETDKANMVYEAESAGNLTEIIAQEGETVAIGNLIAKIGRPDDDSSTNAVADERQIERQAEAPTKASPIARRLAKDKGLDLDSISGSGPGGRIVKVDVERAAAPSSASAATSSPLSTERPPAPSSGQPSTERRETIKGTVQTLPLTKLQQTVSRRMAASKATAPHFYLQASIDMSRCAEARARLKGAARNGEAVPSFNDMVVKACALALGEFPRANGAYVDCKWELYSRINIGIAVAAREALVVPTIFDADLKGLRVIAAESRELARKVREQTVTPPELSGATFTVSNLGMYGIANLHPVINSPQAAILAVGEIAPRPVVRDGAITSAPVMSVTLACDHRILYGADGAELLARVRGLLEEPVGLAL